MNCAYSAQGSFSCPAAPEPWQAAYSAAHAAVGDDKGELLGAGAAGSSAADALPPGSYRAWCSDCTYDQATARLECECGRKKKGKRSALAQTSTCQDIGAGGPRHDRLTCG